MVSIEDLNAALDQDAGAPTLEQRVARIEVMIDAIIGSGSLTPQPGGGDPDAVPGEVHVPVTMRRKAAGDGGSVSAYVYPLPEPLKPLRVRISGEVMTIIYRDSKGETHRLEVPV